VLPSLLHFIGGRPLVGYYVDFDIAMLDKYVLPTSRSSYPTDASRFPSSTTSASMVTHRPIRSSISLSLRCSRILAYPRSPNTTHSTTR
jgi:hypothetical protein